MFFIPLFACATESDVSVQQPFAPVVEEIGEVVEVTPEDSAAVPVETVVVVDPGDVEVVHANPGDTLVGIARLAGVTVEEVAALNGYTVTHPLLAGESVRIPAGTSFVTVREASLDARLDVWFEARGGLVGVQSRTVATGDTAWDIAVSEGVPLWVLSAFNRTVDLGRIRIGDTLTCRSWETGCKPPSKKT